MMGKTQFSLRSLFVVWVYVALAMGFTRYVALMWLEEVGSDASVGYCTAAAAICWGMAAGRPFGMVFHSVSLALVGANLILALLMDDRWK